MLHVFNLSIVKGIFPDDLKIARVTPVFKGGDEKDLENYRPISVLPCFSKKKYAIIQLIDQINNNFENNEFTIGVFIDLSKAFDTVDHRILLKKLIHYGVNGNNIRWFESYLTNRKQYLSFNNKNTNFANITCGVPQGSTLVPLFF